MKETQSQGTQQFILGNLKGKNPAKLPLYRLLEYNAQRTKFHKRERERPNPSIRAKDTKNTSPPPSPPFLFLSLAQYMSERVCTNEGGLLPIYINHLINLLT